MVYQHQAGLANTNSYLSAGFPYLTGSTLLSSSFGTNNAQMQINFPLVTRSITVINTSGSAIRAHFNNIATYPQVVTGAHYTTLRNLGDSITYNVKAREIFISLSGSSGNGAFEIVAELTTIQSKEMVALTGSGLTD